MLGFKNPVLNKITGLCMTTGWLQCLCHKFHPLLFAISLLGRNELNYFQLKAPWVQQGEKLYAEGTLFCRLSVLLLQNFIEFAQKIDPASTKTPPMKTDHNAAKTLWTVETYAEWVISTPLISTHFKSSGTALKPCTVWESITVGNYEGIWILIVTHIKHTESGHLALGAGLCSPLDRLLPIICVFSSVIPVVALSHSSQGQISIAVFTQTKLSPNTHGSTQHNRWMLPLSKVMPF